MFKLPFWRLTSKHPAFYDTESGTAIEQTAKLYGAMRDLIDAYNKFVEETNNAMEAHGEATSKEHEEFEMAIRQEFQDFIDTVELRLNGVPSSEELAEISSKLSNLDQLFTEFEALKNTLPKTYVLDGTYVMRMIDNEDMTAYQGNWFADVRFTNNGNEYIEFNMEQEILVEEPEEENYYHTINIYHFFNGVKTDGTTDYLGSTDGDGWMGGNYFTFDNQSVPYWFYRFINEFGTKQ